MRTPESALGAIVLVLVATTHRPAWSQPVAEIARVQGALAGVAVQNAAGVQRPAWERMLLQRGETILLRGGSTAVVVVAYADGRRVTVCRRDWGETCDATTPYRVTASTGAGAYSGMAWRNLFRGLRVAHDRYRTAGSRSGASRDDSSLQLLLPPAGPVPQAVDAGSGPLTLEWLGGEAPFDVTVSAADSAGGARPLRVTGRAASLDAGSLPATRDLHVRVTDARGTSVVASVQARASAAVPLTPAPLLREVSTAQDSVLVRALYLYTIARGEWRWEACRVAQRGAPDAAETAQLCWAAATNTRLAR